MFYNSAYTLNNTIITFAVKDKNYFVIHVYCIHKTTLNTKYLNYFYFFLVLGICGTFSLIIAQIWSFIVDVNAMNTSQLHHLSFMTEYLVDQEKYFYWILLYMYTVLCIGQIITLGIGTMLVTYIEHICGIFKIARYEWSIIISTA